MKIFTKQTTWLERAEALKPCLKHWRVDAAYAVTPVADAAVWQGYRMKREALGAFLERSRFTIGDSFIVELPESTVGKLHFSLKVLNGYADSPVKLRIILGEMPLEVVTDPATYQGSLSRAWLQDETVVIDDLPCEFALPRRYACRYISFQVLAAPDALVFHDIHMMAEGAESELPPTSNAVDAAAMRTLRNCMQTCFEDGPKRDRRLWMGDLRLQAMVNHVSYRRYDLVERGMYLLAGCTDDRGWIPGCVFERPEPSKGCNTADYALIFSIGLEEHCRWSGNYEIGRELFEVARHQFKLCREFFDERELFIDPCDIATLWVFVDHDHELDRQAAMQGIYIAGLNSLAALADKIGRGNDAAELRREARHLTEIARRFLYDKKLGLIVSGVNRQISCASQVWMILAGVLTPEEGRSALRRLHEYPGTLMPKSPYMYHYLLESYQLCGEFEKLFELIERYWGAMLRHGADTFWEVFVPEKPLFSPYRDARMNSACHAWSCTPSYFIRSLPHKLDVSEKIYADSCLPVTS